MSQEDAAKVKKSILMRYPLSFLEEVSRALIGYKSWRDNKQYYKALPILDTLIDYVTLDPVTRKRIYDMTDEEKAKSPHHFILLPGDLVNDFRMLYHGFATLYHSEIKESRYPLRYLSPGQAIDPSKGVVTIRRPVNFIAAWGKFEPEYIIMKGGFYYTETRYQTTEMGLMPYEVKVPMINFEDPDLKYHECDTVPFAFWAAAYDKGWTEISPICTLIEKIIAETLENAGFHIERGDASSSPPEEDSESDRLKL
jgi:hypothetical protein